MTPRKKVPAKRSEQPIATFGERGRTIRVFRVGNVVRVKCATMGLLQSYRGPEAKAQALGFAQRLEKGVAEPAAPKLVTVAELWNRYQGSSDFEALRPRSRAIYTDAWRLFTSVVPVTANAGDVTAVALETVRMALQETDRKRLKKPLALSTIRKAISITKCVFAWAERVELLPRNRVHGFIFKIPRDKRPKPVAEYSREEFEKLLAGVSFADPEQRTFYCCLILCSYQGMRINAVTRLQWQDVLWADNLILWPSVWSKQGEDMPLPMRATTRATLLQLWETVGRPVRGWVFPPRRKTNAGEVYRKESFIEMLHRVERRVGVAVIRGRASHSFRRKLATDLQELTGNDRAAMHGIGDKTAMAGTYVRRRIKTVAATFDALDAREQSATQSATHAANGETSAP